MASFWAVGSINNSKREIAAFFAHATHETGRKKYFGRGPLQITWNYNYGPAGKSIGFDGLNSPETVANNPVMAFKTALWFWRTSSLQSKLLSQGFSATIRAINGGECSGKKPKAVRAQVTYYTNYCKQFRFAPGRNLYC
ncbi:hypothetical protein NL676_002356 [Syzygium grande]|nr:hypothetical protein NL676_002356 [Syzygium grande]